MAAAVSFHGVRLCVDELALSALGSMLEKFESATPEASEGSLEIALGASAGSASPDLGEALFTSERFAVFSLDGDLVVTNRTSFLRVERTRRRITGHLSPAERAAGEDLLHVALLIALRELAIFELHAAAACTETHALVLVGPSGSGKSTATLALLCAGSRYLGDDRVLLRAGPAGDELLSYPVFFRARATTLASFAELAPHVLAFEHCGKRSIDVSRAFPGRHAESWSGHTVLVYPKIGARTHAAPLGQAPAFERLLLQSGSLALAGHPAPEEHLAHLKRLVARSPRVELSMGPEWLQEPARAARRFLEGVPELSSGAAA